LDGCRRRGRGSHPARGARPYEGGPDRQKHGPRRGGPRMTVPSPRPTPSVLVVGAGPTGLALALWLTRLGVGLRIIDRVAEPGTTSRALAVQARTLELYRQIGIADAVISGGVEVAGVNLWARGARAARLPF